MKEKAEEKNSIYKYDKKKDKDKKKKKIQKKIKNLQISVILQKKV